jgi:hypothetical protein
MWFSLRSKWLDNVASPVLGRVISKSSTKNKTTRIHETASRLRVTGSVFLCTFSITDEVRHIEQYLVFTTFRRAVPASYRCWQQTRCDEGKPMQWFIGMLELPCRLASPNVPYPHVLPHYQLPVHQFLRSQARGENNIYLSNQVSVMRSPSAEGHFPGCLTLMFFLDPFRLSPARAFSSRLLQEGFGRRPGSVIHSLSVCIVHFIPSRGRT